MADRRVATVSVGAFSSSHQMTYEPLVEVSQQVQQTDPILDMLAKLGVEPSNLQAVRDLKFSNGNNVIESEILSNYFMLNDLVDQIGLLMETKGLSQSHAILELQRLALRSHNLNDVLLRSTVFDKAREQIEHNIFQETYVPSGTKSNIPCPRCGSKSSYQSTDTYRGDEAPRIQNICLSCSCKWTS